MTKRSIISGKEALLFVKIYSLFKKRLPHLPLNDYYRCIMPFCYKDDDAGSSNNKVSRYLIGYWDEDGAFQDRPAFKKLAAEIRRIDPGSESLRRLYRDNLLVDQLKANPSICTEIIKALQHEIDAHHIPPVPITALHSFLYKEEYEMFLFSIVSNIFCGKEPILSGPSELMAKFELYNISSDEVLNYSRSILDEIGNNEAFGLLSILRTAGFPGHINRNCDHITLLKAADVYYFHRLTGSKKADPRDIEYSYEYSKTAYEVWESPIAAWNMGYIWYLHETYDPLTRTKIHIPDFSTVDGSEESFLLKATSLFKDSAKKDFPDAFTSLGNICYKALACPEEWATLVSELYTFSKNLVSHSNRHTKDDYRRLANCKTLHEQVNESRRVLYEQAAYLGSFNGKLNYYNLLIKEMMTEDSLSFEEYLQEYDDHIRQITIYLGDLCEYNVPAALTDAATLSLHMHPINEWLEKSKIRLNNSIISSDSDYDLILPHYSHVPKGKNKAIEMLKEANDMTIPSLQTPWPAFYLAKICKEAGLNEDASRYADKAFELQHKLSGSSHAEAYKAKIIALRQECK